MEINSYTAYKSSELEFFAEIPSHWSVWKVTHAFRSIGSGTTPKSDNTTFYDGDIPWITTSELREHVINESKQMVTEQAIREYPTLKMYDPGTLIIAMYGATIGRLGILGVPGTVNQACCVFDESEQLDTKFFFYWLCMYRPTLISLSVGGGQPNLSQDDLKQLRVPAPSISEQTQIAKFLDYKTAQIDRLIEKKKALIEKLNEKRTALITQAVTKGLNPDAPMKDSGVDWLGKVPEHWEVRKLRFILDESLANGIFKKAEFWGEGTRVINVADIYVHNDIINVDQLDRLICNKGEMAKYSAKHGDFFLVRSSLKLEGIGKSATVLNPEEDLVFECHVVRGRPNIDKVNPRFLNLLLNSKYAAANFIAKSNVVTMATIDQDKLKSLFLGIPPLEEQRTICEHLDNTLIKIDGMINVTNKTIDTLNEYRTALITAAVTGKIDVRNVSISEQLASL